MKTKIEAMAKVMEIVIGEAVAKTAKDAGMTVKAVELITKNVHSKVGKQLMNRINQYVLIGMETSSKTLMGVA